MKESFSIRRADASDVPYLDDAVGRLIAELRAVPYQEPDPSDAQRSEAALSLVRGEFPGSAHVAVGEAGRRLGIITASYQSAIRTGGRYALIQELWVASSARGLGVGSALVTALCAAAGASGSRVVEVGLPRPASPVFAQTRSRYTRWGFEELGPRMRRSLSGPDGS